MIPKSLDFSVQNPNLSAVNAALRDRLLPIYGRPEADAMIRLIWLALKGWSTTDIAMHFDYAVPQSLIDSIGRILARLENHEPIQYILGRAYFYGLDLQVNPDVLIPRPETAELVDIIVTECTEPDLHVLDVGTGSGAIAIALARNLKFPVVTALDVSEEALVVAKGNARNLHSDIRFVKADIFSWEPPQNSLDVVVSNPPYIAESEKKEMESNVLDYEPHTALFVPDDDPLCFYIRIADMAFHGLRPDGRIYFEINPRYYKECMDMLNQKGYADVEVVRDSYGKYRFVKARREGGEVRVER